jgi:hypothetical protein
MSTPSVRECEREREGGREKIREKEKNIDRSQREANI